MIPKTDNINQKAFKPGIIPFFLRVGLLLPPAFLYAVRSDMPHIFLITLILLLLPVFRHEALPYAERTFLYAIVADAVLILLPDLFISMPENRYGLLDSVTRSNLLIPLLLYSSALICLFRQNPFVNGILIAVSFMSTLICGDIFSTRTLTNVNMPFTDSLIRNYQLTYITVVLIQSLSVLLFLTSDARQHPETAGLPNRKQSFRFDTLTHLFKFFCLLLVPLLAVLFAWFYLKHELTIKQWELFLIRLGTEDRRNSASEQAEGPRQTDLSHGFFQEFDLYNKRVLLRIKSISPPGYLRSASYDVYRDGIWSSSGERQYELPATYRTELISYNTFTVSESDPGKTLKKMELYTDPVLAKNILPSPGNVQAFDILADKMFINDNGIFTLRHWMRDGGCTFLVPREDAFAAYPFPKSDWSDFPVYTRITGDQLQQQLAQTVKDIYQTDQPRKFEKDDRIIKQLTDYFQKYFTYELPKTGSARGKKRLDPTIRFLNETKKGHCELFASAAALTLRKIGIPTRYVTGFVCMERHPSGLYYYATGNNAHAWCEAYLADENRWVIVEATPPTAFEQMRTQFDWTPMNSWKDRLNYLMADSIAMLRRGYFAGFVVQILITGFDLAEYFLLSVPGVLFLLLILLGTLFLWFKRNPKRRRVLLPENRQALQRVMTDFEKHLVRNGKNGRNPGESLREWGERIFPLSNDREEFFKLTILYESIRFREKDCSPEKIRLIRRLTENFLRRKK